MRRLPWHWEKSIASADIPRREVENAASSYGVLDGEPEVAWADLNDDMDLAEAFIEHIVQTVLKNSEPS